MSSPQRPSFSFSSFFVSPISLVRPRRRLSPAPTAYCRGRRAQMAVKAGRSSAATPPGPRPLQRSSTTAGLIGRVDYSCLLPYPSSCQRWLFRSRIVLSAGLATKPMARAMFASTYIRQLRSGLPRCCLHGRSRRRDGTHLWDGRLASANLRCGHTATHPTRPTHRTGVGTQRTVDVIA